MVKSFPVTGLAPEADSYAFPQAEAILQPLVELRDRRFSALRQTMRHTCIICQ